MNVIYATFIREWTDPEDSLYPGLKGGARPGAREVTGASDRNLENVPSSGEADCSSGGDKKSGRQARLVGLTPPFYLGRNGSCARTSIHNESPGWSNGTVRGASLIVKSAKRLKIADNQIPQRRNRCQSAFSCAMYENGQYPTPFGPATWPPAPQA
jgi:hypothetical protein